MKIQITLKDPDGVSDCIDCAARESVEGLDIPEDEADALIEIRQEKLLQEIKKWVKYQEYVRIEIDTVAGTAIVLEAV